VKKLLILICLSVIFFTACSDASPDKLLLYQNYPLRLSAIYTCESNEYSVEVAMTGPNTGSVKYITPQSLTGFTISVTADGIILSGDGYDVPVPETGIMCDGEVIFAMLSLSTGNLISAKVHKGQVPLSVALFESKAGNIELTLNSDSKPLRIYAVDKGILLKGIFICDEPV
jgi:hypothetical protein